MMSIDHLLLEYLCQVATRKIDEITLFDGGALLANTCFQDCERVSSKRKLHRHR
jgi:hypothetical protein